LHYFLSFFFFYFSFYQCEAVLISLVFFLPQASVTFLTGLSIVKKLTRCSRTIYKCNSAKRHSLNVEKTKTWAVKDSKFMRNVNVYKCGL
jgi:hypothetical protein